MARHAFTRIVLVDAMVGEYDTALDLLDKLLSMPGDNCVNLVKLDSTWAPLRDLPRFKKLIEKYE